MSNKQLKQLLSGDKVVLRSDIFMGDEAERTFCVGHNHFGVLHGLLDGSVYRVSYNDVERIL
jgi:hypothetical protein